LGNYRRLVEALDTEVKRSERTGRLFAVLLVDFVAMIGAVVLTLLAGFVNGRRMYARQL
jgi:hypothetical protein